MAGLGLKLAATECAFRARDEGAFPHVNFYVEDPQLGVRLQPGASMRLGLGRNPRTTIHVNASGHRGADWPEPPQSREIVVVGDSQVFGLGVEAEEMLASRLAERTGRPVIGAGVPTYGPREYLEVARDLLVRRRPETVVVVLDFVDDPFELGRPNSERHAVWDGWAVRRETMPDEVTQFPGRTWLMSRSHAVYALRRWLHARGSAGERLLDPGTPSEGGWEDLVPASLRTQAQQAEAGHERPGASGAQDELRAQEDGQGELAEVLRSGEAEQFWRDEAGRPGDIVDSRLAVSGRSIAVTAELFRHAVSFRGNFKGQQRKLARAQAARLRELQAAAATLTESREAVMAELARSAPRPRPESVFAAYLAEFQALCAAHGAELVVVALPLDVQVDGGEWAKYGVTQGPDMRPSQILLTDLVADAEALRIRSVDATAALRAAQPGAFLEGDFHLTARGHAAVAEALAERLARPLPPRAPDPGLPQGTGYAPAQRAWEAVEAVPFAGWATGTAQHVGGWLKLRLSAADDVEPVREIEVIEGSSPAAMRMTTATGMTLVTPLAIGAPLRAHLYRLDGGGELQIRWQGERLQVKVTARPAAPERTLTFTRPPDALCRCDVCDEMWGDPALFPACEAAYSGAGEEACEALLGCVRHDPLFAPGCPEGQVHAFASNACFTPCDEDNPCAEGRCTPWHGAAVCVSEG
ncbi:alginate O-acetyltransferase AlgX-related protein [Nannocystis pusilla]|uniref:alginate O-acetyltransferase AlgX-related protein n=1 Tax=Nannocystis pusilla TaxID=889268 RepID=UPI003DA29AD4